MNYDEKLFWRRVKIYIKLGKKPNIQNLKEYGWINYKL